VGVLNTVISYGVYTGLVYLGVPYIAANVIAFVASVLNSFFWNRKLVFAQKNGEVRNTVRVLVKMFIAYGFTGFILGNFMLFLLVARAGLSKYIAPVFLLPVLVPLNFVLIKLWAFKTR
jgi:putative flippase GtrA